jgi:hypothetical protein
MTAFTTFAKLAAATAVVVGLAAAGSATAEPTGCKAADFHPLASKVAIDRDSGLAFVHSPCGYTFMGVVARETIEQDIAMSGAEAVPVAVVRAEVAKRPELAQYLPKVVASAGIER